MSFKEQQHQLWGDELRMLLFSALRYAIGRRTYIVSDTCDTIRKHASCLSAQDRRQFIEEIETEGRLGCLGDECDQADWRELVALLKANPGEER